ncbi:hypothetical protein C2G38_2193954 [Gigaspora rosea]|uniref:FAD-dependent oxidoreductase 2 FAD-binding domain-containing protein n=1 Tax=Gigaspora rosea TaxID=44941 RepID=A0A397UYM1_9GLOM|nr:hypothetical protein C2G38_2193954 [Gigaspora rosea]
MERGRMSWFLIRTLSLVATQRKQPFGVQDSAEIFAQGTARSARDLAHPDLIKVLTGNSAEKFKLDLSLVSRLGGHSQPRTYRGKEMFPEYGPVILATGGYAADFKENPLLKKYHPDIYNLPTTNSEGDGHKMVIAIGGKATYMEKVQVQPTGLLSKEIEWHFKHYVGRGLMRKFSGEALANCLNVSRITLCYGQRYVIPGLFASGEIAGGVHGANRILPFGCVVYGRVADDSASRYLFQNLSRGTANCRLGKIARQLAPYQIIVSVDPTNQKQYTPPVQAPQASPRQAPAPEKKADAPTREKKEYTAEEVAKHNKENG